MAAVTGVQAASATLSGTTADTVTLTGRGSKLIVTNHDVDTPLYFTLNGTTAVAQADENYAVAPGRELILDGALFASPVISVVGDGGAYTVALF